MKGHIHLQPHKSYICHWMCTLTHAVKHRPFTLFPSFHCWIKALLDFSPDLFFNTKPLREELHSLSLSQLDSLKNNIDLLKYNRHAHVSIHLTLFSLDTQFRMSILERLEQMEQRMAEITNQNPSSETIATKGGGVEGGGATDQHSQVRQKDGIKFGWNFPSLLNDLKNDKKMNTSSA